MQLIFELIFELIIPFCAPSLNSWYSSRHWTERKKIADTWHKATWALCKEARIQPIKKFPIIIKTQSSFKGYRLHETVNQVTANKLVEDGFVKANIIPNDTPEYVSQHIVDAPTFGHKHDMTFVWVYRSLNILES